MATFVKPDDTIKSQEVPRDAKIIALILKSMGVEEYEPRVINQLLEFMHRYTVDIFKEAKVYSEHADKDKVDIEDVRLAIQTKVNHSFTQPPPREFLLELAQKKNLKALPVIPDKHGVLLPPDQYCLNCSNYTVIPSEASRKKRSKPDSGFSSSAKKREKMEDLPDDDDDDDDEDDDDDDDSEADDK